MQEIQEEQISSKELILKLINLKNLIASQWRLVIIFMALGALFSLLLDWQKHKETQYTASMTFNLESGGTAGGTSDLAGLASAFGMGGGGGNRSAEIFSTDNFNELIQSKVIYERALMKSVKVNGKTLLFANYFKDSSDIARKEWGGNLFRNANTPFINYHFTQKDPKSFTRKENEIITSIFDKLTLQTNIGPVSKMASFTEVSCITTNEMLSKVWLETLMETMQEFYKELKTQKTRDILVVQEKRLAALRDALYTTDSKLAAVTNQNLNVVDAAGPTRQAQLSRSSGYTSTQYYTQMTNVESLRMLLINQTPLFTILNPIRLPLKEVKWHIGNNTTLGCLLGLIFAIGYLIIRKTYQDIMADRKN